MTPEITPGPWYVLEVMGHSFLAAAPTEDHPYHGRTRHIDVAGDEDYPRKKADLKLESAAPDMAALLLESRDNIGGDWRERRDAALKKAGWL